MREAHKFATSRQFANVIAAKSKISGGGKCNFGKKLGETFA